MALAFPNKYSLIISSSIYLLLYIKDRVSLFLVSYLPVRNLFGANYDNLNANATHKAIARSYVSSDDK